MPTTSIQPPSMGMGVEELTNLMFQYYRELTYLLNGNLDTQNVREITTDVLVAGTAKISTALIEDLVVGTNVQIGSAEDAAGVTTIIGNTVTTTFVNALSITAGSVAAENITGTKITGKTIVGGTFMNSAETYQLTIGLIGSDTAMLFSESDGDRLFGVYNQTGNQIAITGKGSIPFIINDGTFPGKTYPYGGWDFSSCTVSNFPGYTHNHDGRYFTETESDGRYATSGHDHGNSYVKTSQNIKIQYFSDHIEVQLDNGTWKVIYFAP